MDLNEAIKKFLSSLELTDRQSTLVVDRNNALRDRLDSMMPFSIIKTPLYGSYERDSQIRPLPNAHWALDVDTLAILEPSTANHDRYFHNSDGGWKLLCEMQQGLKGFKGLEVEIDAPSISVKWETLKMKIEVTPAFTAKNGGLLIPSSSADSLWGNEWQLTNPLGDSEKLTTANKLCNGGLKPLTKALKCWNRKAGLMSSFAIECIAYHTAGNDFRGFNFELPWFFKRLLENDGKSYAPPSGIGSEVKLDLGFNRYKVENALKYSEEAFRLASRGYHRLAIEEMGKVFGPPFPLSVPPTIWSSFYE